MNCNNSASCSPFFSRHVHHVSLGCISTNQRVGMNGPISKAVSAALARVFSWRSAILKIVEEKALGTRLGSRSPDNAEFDHFTLLFCRRQRNVPRTICCCIFVRLLGVCLFVCLFPSISILIFYFLGSQVTVSTIAATTSPPGNEIIN